MNPRTGWLRKLESGKWEARIQFTDPATGKRRDIRHIRDTKGEAHDELNRLRRDIDAGQDTSSRRTLFDLFDHYADTYLHAPCYLEGRKVSGYVSWRSEHANLAVLRRLIADKPLRSVSYPDLERAKLAVIADPVRTSKKVMGSEGVTTVVTERPRSTANVHRILSTLRHCLTIAEREGWVARSPFVAGEPLIRPSHEKRRTRVLSRKEEADLLAGCEWRSHLRLIIIALLDTGMRFGEMRTRRRRDFDFIAQEISITSGAGFQTKNEDSRVVPMSDRLRDELVTQGVDALESDALAFGIVDNVRASFRTAKRIAGITNLRPHDLRHTAASRMIEDGMELAEVARILGHRDIRTTYRYVSAHAGTVTRAREAINRGNVRDVEGDAVN